MTLTEQLYDGELYITSCRDRDIPDDEIFTDLITQFHLDYDSAIYLLEQ